MAHSDKPTRRARRPLWLRLMRSLDALALCHDADTVPPLAKPAAAPSQGKA